MRIEHTSIELLTILSENSPISEAQLAEHFHVTPRTIRSYLNELEEVLINLDVNLFLDKSDNKNIKLRGNYNTLALVMQRLNRLSMNEEKDRVALLINDLITTSEYTTLQALADKLFISKSTVEKTINDARNFLNELGFNITGSRKGIKLIATEIEKRKILSKLIKDYWKGVLVNLDYEKKTLSLDVSLNVQSQEMISKEIIHRVQKLTNEFIFVENIEISDYQYQSLIIHTAIAIDRINKNQLAANVATKEQFHQLTEEFVSKIEQEFQMTFPEYEKVYLNIYMEAIFNRSIHQRSKIELDELEYGTEIAQTFGRYLMQIKPDDELIRDLSFHLNTTLKRLQKNIRIKNPYKDKIKKEYTTAYNLAIEIGLDLSDQTDFAINVDEITYIAIHIQAFFERTRKEQLEVVLVCASGFGTAKLLEQRIIQKFGEKINITDIIGINNLREILTSDKTIISTIPINSPMNDVIYVNPLLTGDDIKAIQHRIDRSLIKGKDYFRKYIDPNLIFFSKGQNENVRSIIEFMVSQLIFRGYATVGFLESVLKREALTTTAIDYFAMPHGDSRYIEKSVVGIYINPEGIKWGRNTIKVAFLMALNPDEVEDISCFYKSFNLLISEESFKQSILQLNSKSEAKELFIGKERKK